MSGTNNQDTIRFVDSYQTPLNAGTYEVTATLNEPEALKGANISTSTTVKLHVAGPRFFLPSSEIHSVFPPENGAGDYNNILPHIVLNCHTLPWERLVDEKVDAQHGTDLEIELEKIPFLALLVFSEDEETNGYGLSLMALNNATDLPSVGNSLVFVAKVGEFYHARIFDRTGAIVVGNGNSQFSPSRELEETLLMSFRGATIGTSIPVSDQVKRDIIRKITSILGHPEANSDVTPPATVSLGDLLIDLNFKYALEPGEKLTDKINVIDVKSNLLKQIMPTGEELCLLAHGREYTSSIQIPITMEQPEQRAVVIANRLPAPPPQGEIKKRNTAHLVMLENCFQYKQAADKHTWSFPIDENSPGMVRLVCLKSWQFNCTTDEPTLSGRLLSDAFTFELFCVPEPEPKLDNNNPIEQIRLMSYTALHYFLRWGDRAHTLYRGPLVASAVSKEIVDVVDGQRILRAPASADGLVRLLQNERIFDVSLAAAWQLGQMLMLRDQSIAMEYFSWRRRDAQLRTRQDHWEADGHLHLGDNAQIGLTALPKNVQDWCQKHLELRGLPFEYLIPDARMLPENSLRIFCIHETWMECLLSGALAVGRGGDADRILEAEYRSILYPESAQNRTGFLLRSPAVDEHPDLKVVAQGATSEVRLERIGPGLLLGLYDGTFSKLQFSLPPIGLHFGFKEKTGVFVKDVKNPQNGGEVGEVNAPLKSERVVDITDLCNHISKMLQTASMPRDLTPGSFAFQIGEGAEMVEFGVNRSSN